MISINRTLLNHKETLTVYTADTRLIKRKNETTKSRLQQREGKGCLYVILWQEQNPKLADNAWRCHKTFLHFNVRPENHSGLFNETGCDSLPFGGWKINSSFPVRDLFPLPATRTSVKSEKLHQRLCLPKNQPSFTLTNRDTIAIIISLSHLCICRKEAFWNTVNFRVNFNFQNIIYAGNSWWSKIQAENSYEDCCTELARQDI